MNQMLAIKRSQLGKAADWLIIAAAASLPWSTSATSILVPLWALVLIASVEWPELKSAFSVPAAGLATLLFALAVAGILWSDADLHARFKGVSGFAKLLAIPLLIVHFRTRPEKHNVFLAFLCSCIVLLAASWVHKFLPSLVNRPPGILVKNYMTQSYEFLLSAAVLLVIAYQAATKGRRILSIALLALSVAFVLNIVFVATSRTTIVVMCALGALYGWRTGRWKGSVGALLAIAVVCAGAWLYSPYFRDRIESAVSEFQRYSQQGVTTSTGVRIVYWSKSIHAIAEAPLIGHGTGSIENVFRRAAVGQTGIEAEIANNPHNELFVAGIQLGIPAILILLGIWGHQLWLFRGRDLVSLIGSTVVVATIVGGLSFSLLSDFTEGWIFVVGTGAAMGMVLGRDPRHNEAPSNDAM